MKEPEIKLFGRKILLLDNSGDCSVESSSGGDDCDRSLESSGGGGEADDEIQLHAHEDQEAEQCETRMQENDQNQDAAHPTASSELDENPKTPTAEEDVASESSNPTVLKKPDKIIKCPRCNSMDTKFCYYNNYNANQPRHFCKSCQRYWTAGGTMRNVPVGAGRRKNKNPASHWRHISISEVLQAARVDVPPNGFLHPPFRPNDKTNSGTVLSFGSDSPLCKSMASAMNISNKRNGYCKMGETRDDCSMGSTTTTSGSVPEGGMGPQQAVMPNLNGVPFPIPCIPGVAWPIPWNPAMPLPAMCPPGYPMPVYPAPYWNCGPPNAWNVPWVPGPSPATNQKAKASGPCPNSPLGKHSRNGELLKPSNAVGLESSILVPKTLRIDDPEEAAKSSIWETLGIKYDSISREGLFKALQPKGDGKKLMVPASPVMQANPAAMSRSISFQEGA